MIRGQVRRTTWRVIAGLAVVGALTSCSSDNLDADSVAFAGLDPAVVQEVRQNSVAWGKIEQEDEATRSSLAQGIVRNFIQCRSAFEAYETWRTTGESPTLAEQPVPATPLEPSNGAIISAQEYVEDAIASGEPSQLRDFLVGEARCGEWIPVTANDPTGPSIEDAVERLG